MKNHGMEVPQESFRDIFEYVAKRDAKEKGFRDSIMAMYKRNATWSNVILRAIVNSLALFIRPRKNSIKYFFWGTKFEELILTLPQHEICVVGGPRQVIFCLKNKLYFIPEARLWAPLYEGMRSGRMVGIDTRLSCIITSLGSKIKKCSHKDAVFIVDNDSLPAQRLAIISARKAGVTKSICIQHGIFQSKSPGDIFDGWFSDRFFVINQNQKQLLIDKGMDAGKIEVMGFHSSPYKPARPLSPPGSRKVCLIGQPWGKYGKGREEKYLKILDKVTNILHGKGYQVCFKPHPWERGSDYLKNFSNVVDISMSDALENYDAFISITSTALVEAAVSGRIAVQLVDPEFDADRLSSEFSEVVSLDVDAEEFENALEKSMETDRTYALSRPLPLHRRFYMAVDEG
ncbi:hypothetical protein ACM26W_11000 [Halomonas sp. HK25]|uniref:hypothetical protein n=1 Tax=Halomonas sp. HK25 TaxID=3394321 RepID=UPI0039FC623E